MIAGGGVSVWPLWHDYHNVQLNAEARRDSHFGSSQTSLTLQRDLSDIPLPLRVSFRKGV